MSIFFLVLLAAAVYFLWFHKYTLQDGTEVKGWLAKYKAEHGNLPFSNAPQQPAPSGQTTTSVSMVSEDNPTGLCIHSSRQDFDKVLKEAETDLFGKSWDLLEGYFGWLLLGLTRDDALGGDAAWRIMSKGCAEFKEVLRDYYDDGIKSGEHTKEQRDMLPEWMVNQHLLNAFGFFIQRAHIYIEPSLWNNVEGRVNQWYDDFRALQKARGTEIDQQPIAAEYLARLYTILHNESDAQVAKNEALFRQKYQFDFDMP